MRKVCFWNLCLIFLFTSIVSRSQTTLLSENFNAGDPPAGWTKFNYSTGGNPAAADWTIQPDGYVYIFSNPSFFRIFHSNDNSQFYISNSDAQDGDETITMLQSPSFNTLPFTHVNLQFYTHYRQFQEDISQNQDDTAFVEISTDGSTWNTVLMLHTDPEDSIGAANAFAFENINLDAYIGNATVSLRFRYHAFFGYYWAIDNVLVRGSNSPLPVSLYTFSGYKDGTHNLLKWSTASEQNNRGFELERSNDGTGYSSIGFIPSQASFGNSSSLLNYSFIDNFPTGDKQYYRLRQVDLNGNEKLSNIVLIRSIPEKIFSVDAIFPDPAHSVLNMSINALHHDEIVIQVFDLGGRMLKQQNSVTEKGSNTVSLDVSALMNGVYTIRVVSSTGETAVSKFIKQ